MSPRQRGAPTTSTAAVVAGYVLAHHEPYGFECDLGFPDRTLEIIRQHPQVDEWMARGAAMDRHHIVEHMLQHSLTAIPSTRLRKPHGSPRHESAPCSAIPTVGPVDRPTLWAATIQNVTDG